MDESLNHHSQQTDTRTESQTPYVLTHRWVLNNENTWAQGGELHTLGSVEGWMPRGRRVGMGQLEGQTLGEMSDVGHGGMETANHHVMYVPMQ